MKSLRILTVAAILAASASVASADSRTFHAYLYGGNERPAAGDPDAFGSATVTLISPTALCYSIVVQNVAVLNASPNGAHIHAGAAGVVGGPVVPLPTNALVPVRVASCVNVAAATITAIRTNPQNFYVNIHNAAFPGGAARGQLE